MKKEDFELLKAVCEKNGFKLIDVCSPESIYQIKKKDEWEGVEFVEILKDWNGFKVGSIGRIIEEKFNGYIVFSPIGVSSSGWSPNAHYAKDLNVIKPSTEQAYVEQLKKTVFEKFGEIKDGDRFVEPSGKIDYPTTSIKEWDYFKQNDQLFFHDLIVYEQGKWAERVKEKVEVFWSGLVANDYNLKITFDLEDAVRYTDNYRGGEIGRFLAEQLEKYLNDEK